MENIKNYKIITKNQQQSKKKKNILKIKNLKIILTKNGKK